VPSLGDTVWVFLGGLILCLISGRFAIRWLAKSQCVAPVRYEDCPPLQAYQEAKPRTPTMGGLFVLGAGILAAASAGGLRDAGGWLVLAAAAGLGFVGLLDDLLKFRGANAVGLRTAPKLMMTLVVGAAVGIASGSRPVGYGTLDIPWAGRTVELGWLWVPFAMTVIAGCAHAVNLTDGMDGLAAGCLAITFSVLGLIALAWGPQAQGLGAWCAALAGACVGFLWFNSFPASIVLGDVGALGLGAALGTISLLTHGALWLIVIGGVFVAEALSVMLQVASYKWRGGRRLFRVAPIHHHFHLGGLAEPKVIVRFWIVGLIFALLGLTGAERP